MTILSNSATSDFLSLASEAAKDARSNLVGGAVRMRDMSRNMFLAATALDSKVTVDGMVADVREAIGWDKAATWATSAGGGATRRLTADEVKSIKTKYDVCFTHVRFFVGEFTATNVKADVAAIRKALETGEMALSTAYKAIRDARRAAAKAAEALESKAESDAALASATETLPAKGDEPSDNDGARFVADLLAMAERLAGFDVTTLTPEQAAAIDLLDTAIIDFGQRTIAARDAESEAEGEAERLAA